MSTAALTLSTFNSAQILTLEMQIINNNKRVDHLVDITSLHENHFLAVDKKLDDVTDILATLIKINKVHYAKMTDFMEQNLAQPSPFRSDLYTLHTTIVSHPELVTTRPSLKLLSMSMKLHKTAIYFHSSISLQIFFWWRHPTFTNPTRKHFSWSFTCPW
jgi:hypothetical protein